MNLVKVVCGELADPLYTCSQYISGINAAAAPSFNPLLLHFTSFFFVHSAVIAFQKWEEIPLNIDEKQARERRKKHHNS